MGLPEKPTLSFLPTSSYTLADLYGEGSTSNEQRQQMRVFGTSSAGQNNSCVNFIINRTETPTRNKNPNKGHRSNTWVVNHNHNSFSTVATNSHSLNCVPNTYTTSLTSNTSSNNNANMTTTTQLRHQQSIRRYQRRPSNSPPIEYINMGNCSCRTICFQNSGPNLSLDRINVSSRRDMPRFLPLYIYDTTNEVHNRMAHFGGEEQSGLKREIVEGLIDFLDNHNALCLGGKLFQLYVVTAYYAVEQTWLDYIHQTQNEIRNKYFSGIYDAIIRGDRDGSDLGTRTVLSVSFTGGPRYMYAYYLDALAICRVHGNPSFFITFTCNAKWPEIQEYIDLWPKLTTADRADIVDHVFAQKAAVRVDNSYVVPFNRVLCMRYYARINVEYCGWTMVIKYLFKYISKRTDRVVANITTPIDETASTSNSGPIHIDEIKNFVEAKYIGPHEACWRILEFLIHYRDPTVLTLAVHSENMQEIRFRSKDNLQAIVDNPTKKKTTLTKWLDYNERAACEALGLTGSDEEWVTALEEAALHASSDQIRKVLSRLLQIPRVEENETEMKGVKLFEIGAILNSNSRKLKDFRLPMPPRKLLHILENQVILEERNYDLDLMLKEKDILLPKLNKDQKLILDEFLKAVNNNQQTLIFVYGHGGTGKTFLWKSIACVLRSKERVVLAVASSEKQTKQTENSSTVQIPDELSIADGENAIRELINFIYDSQTFERPTAEDLQKKVIVCPKNKTADTINSQVLSLLNQQQHVYMISDEATPHMVMNDSGETELLYPNEYLNSVNFTGLPPHRLELKVGAPIILLRNLNITGGLCNGA
nr:DNA helicase [Tanacetum cinerariifolium]